MKKILFLVMLTASSGAIALPGLRFQRRVNRLAHVIHHLRVVCGLPVESTLRYGTANYIRDLDAMRIKLADTITSRNRWRGFALAQTVGIGTAYWLYGKPQKNAAQPDTVQKS